MHTIKKKMTDLEVVQRTLDFWDPLGQTIYSGGPSSQMSQYDRYSDHVYELLQNGTSELELRSYLEEVSFKKIGSSPIPRRIANNRFRAWALLQTWEAQQKPETNFHLVETSLKLVEKSARREHSRYQMIQRFLQDWDPKKEVKHWLCGIDCISVYDQDALAIDELFEARSPQDILAVALALITRTESEKIGFCLDHRNLSTSEREDLLLKQARAEASKYEQLVSNLTYAAEFTDSRKHLTHKKT